MYITSYFPENIMSADKIRKEHGIGGKNLLLACRRCFDTNVELPTSDRKSNLRQKQVQNIATWKRQVAKYSKNGRSKAMGHNEYIFGVVSIYSGAKEFTISSIIYISFTLYNVSHILTIWLKYEGRGVATNSRNQINTP